MQRQTRIIIENVLPQLDNGAFAIKRIVGQSVKVTADVFADGHDVLECCINFKHESDKKWKEVALPLTGSDKRGSDKRCQGVPG